MRWLGLAQSPIARILACVWIFTLPFSASAALQPEQLGIIVNDADELSVSIGEFYAERRNIPKKNVIHVNFRYDQPVLDSATFSAIFKQVKAESGDDIQAYALTWTRPYRVDCMSITSAFAFGYAPRYCASGCKATAPNPYYDSSSIAPMTDYRMRPTISIAATTLENAKFLIERGIQSDFTKPNAHAYLVVTNNKARSTRAPYFPETKLRLSTQIPITIEHSQGLYNKFDIMFYFTGIANVPHLDSVGFLPGAMADHLTSAGGQLPESSQMSALRWLEAGATGSYGTVVEPCNFPQKFPQADVAMKHYLAGNTLIEAYWKSVRWPGQGIFIGEPLAKPYAVRNAIDPRTGMIIPVDEGSEVVAKSR
ncbi:MAG: TIGR03790 family protein [Proteobacteria bacterium]|nr:TIGR03790 family protein [Pseudomonadota bacterium]